MKITSLPPHTHSGYTHDISFNTRGDYLAISSAAKIFIYTHKNNKYTSNSLLSITNKNQSNSFHNDKYPYNTIQNQNHLSNELYIKNHPNFTQIKNQHQQPINSNLHTIMTSIDNNQPQNGHWILEAILEGLHTEPVWRVDWAPQQFGNLIASCSQDRTINIWLEAIIGDLLKWICVATFKDAKRPVTDLQWASPNFGLRLASCDEEGSVRVYELSTKEWNRPQLDEQFYCHNKEEGGCTGLSWNFSNTEIMLIAIIGKNGSLKIFGKNWNFDKKWKLFEQSNKYHEVGMDVSWSPNFCRPYDMIATSGQQPSIILWRFDIIEAMESNDESIDEQNNLSTHYRRHFNRQWASSPTLAYQSTNLIKRGLLIQLQTFQVSHFKFWRVSWNAFGTTLSAASDYKIYFWKPDDSYNWKKVGEIDQKQQISIINSL